ncbi:MAG TPA: SBBP repeat-containing protein, partial [Terriglobales bacterium]
MTLRSVRLGTAGWRCRAILATAILAAVAVGVLHFVPRAADSEATATSQPTKSASYLRLPIMFEPNQGQTAEPVKFLARGAGYGLFLTETEAVLVLRDASKGDRSLRESVVRMKLAKANKNPELSGDEQLPGKSNYFLGNDPAKWHRGIPQFGRVRYENVYPGVDLVYYGKQGSLEYDFAIAPGSDPNQIKLHFEGADSLTIAENGDLQLNLPTSSLRLLAPRVYQKFGTEEKSVAAKFQLLADNQVGFALGDFDHTRELVIDPVLTYSTYLGGSGIESCSTITGLTQTPGCPGIAADTSYNAYVAGSTTSTNFPVISGSFQLTPATGFKANVFVSKFNASGTALIYSTYLGGDGLDYTGGIAVDLAGNAYVTGTTTSTNFPTKGLNAPFQATPVTIGKHAFLSVLNGAGSGLNYSTYLSGNGTDIAAGIALDPSANVYIVGTTTSKEVETGFPSTVGAYQITSNAPTQVFLTKLDSASAGPASVLYSTYFGGSAPSGASIMAGGIAVDTDSNAYITGSTNFTNLPVLNAYQGTPLGGFDAFVAKFNPTAVSGSQLVYSTYLGGPRDDFGYGIAVDASFFAYVTGATSSDDDFGISQTTGTTYFQPVYGGGASDAFIAKLGVTCTGTSCVNTTVPLSYFTYVGGSGTDVGTAITVDTIGGPRITGWTNSTTGFMVVNNRLPQTGYGGGASDAFITRVDTTA